MIDDILIFSVYEVTVHLKQVIETAIEPLYVAGEISNFVHHSSGHIYFNLKDANATMRCTFFRNANYRLDFKPEDGMQVVCFGKLTVFEKSGQYNLNVQTMQQAGKGDLARQFELLKSKLDAEGLFAAEHKQALPKFPERIGIVSSPTGAALQDITNILRRRYPVEAIVYPALVQGDEAPAQLIKGIQYFNQTEPVDIIIIARGGGSQEDLWAFNNEGLARAIFASKIPVISGVGHEIDFTICDFVSDLRAPTPSAAAELAVPDKTELLSLIGVLGKRLSLSVSNSISNRRQNLIGTEHRLERYHPLSVLNSMAQRLDLASNSLAELRYRMTAKADSLENLANKLQSGFDYRFKTFKLQSTHKLESAVTSMQNSLQTRQDRRNEALGLLGIRLEESSPQHILAKGYALVQKRGKIIRTVSDLTAGDEVEISLHKGSANATVSSIGGQK